MRNEVCSSLQALYNRDPFVFLTGDLGYAALEPLRDVMGIHFVNAGVAEQNMMSVAAGMASQGMKVWVYSIAPFCYARPFEQIRNDICLHGFPVKLVGNGGGYAYGAMGSSHHALEDYGVLLTLSGMRVYVPAFARDLEPIINKLAVVDHPAYLRLGRCELGYNSFAPDYSSWRRLKSGNGPILLVIGPLAGCMLNYLEERERDDSPEIWVVSELPLTNDRVSEDFLKSLRDKRKLCIAEEHVSQGGLGQIMCHYLALSGITIESYRHVCAQGYPTGLYGSQLFHRRECGIDPEAIIQIIESM